MKLKQVILALVLVLAAMITVPVSSAPMPVPVASQTLRVMPLGDSITVGIGDGPTDNDGYRCALRKRLTNAGFDIDYVGSQSNGPAACPAGDIQHEGHSGWKISDIQAQVTNWITTYQPDVILLMIGTNDIKQKYDMTNMGNRLSTLLDTIRTAKPDVVIIVSTIVQFVTSDQSQIDAWNNYLAVLPNIASSHGAYVAFENQIIKSWLADGVHPKQCAYDGWMTFLWYYAWMQAFPDRIYNPLPYPISC